MGKTIGILSLKGGVGKTSAVLSLGSAVAEAGKKVLIVDGNFSAPNLGVHLNVISPEVTLHHVIGAGKDIRNAIQKMDDFNFDFLPASIFYRGRFNPLRLREKLRKLKRKYDIILIDSSPALNDETLAVMLASDNLFVVTTPDYPTLSTTLKSIKDARSRGIAIDGLILNKVYNKPFELSISEIEDTAEVPVMAVIPHDVNVIKSASNFVPAFVQNPRSRGSEEFRKLAGTVIGEKYRPAGLRRFLKFRINPKYQDVNRELYYKRVFG